MPDDLHRTWGASMTMSTRPPGGQDGGYGQDPYESYPPQSPSPYGTAGQHPGHSPRRSSPLRRPVVLISAATVVIVAAALVVAVQVLGGGGKGNQAAPVAGSAAAQGGPSASPGGNAGAAPDAGAGHAVTYGPVIARMPAGSAGSRHPTPSASASKSGSASPSASASSSSSPAGNTPAPPASSTCASPQFVTSDQQGGQTFGNYYVTNDMWNVGNYSVSQTLSACSYHSWYVTATMNNNAGDGAVKTYPNVHQDFNEPKITGFNNISATFAQSGTPGGIYEYAFDVWINGVADSNSTEVMVWTQNHGQTPSGSTMGRMTAGGHSFQVWKAGTYIAFVADQNFSSGTVDLLSIFKYVIGKGWLTNSATLGQIDYGVELVSTNNTPATFSINNFSIAAS
jgi:hypothetical protein